MCLIVKVCIFDIWVMLNIPFSRLLVSISPVTDTRFTYSLNLCLHEKGAQKHFSEIPIKLA